MFFGFLFILNLLLSEIRPSVVFSGAPETLANHSVPTESVSLPEHYICCLDWLDPLFVQRVLFWIDFILLFYLKMPKVIFR